MIWLLQCFDYPNYIRIVLTVPDEQLREACTRIAHFCSAHYVGEHGHPRNIIDIHDKMDKLTSTTTSTATLVALEPWEKSTLETRKRLGVPLHINIYVFFYDAFINLQITGNEMNTIEIVANFLLTFILPSSFFYIYH